MFLPFLNAFPPCSFSIVRVPVSCLLAPWSYFHGACLFQQLSSLTPTASQTKKNKGLPNQWTRPPNESRKPTLPENSWQLGVTELEFGAIRPQDRFVQDASSSRHAFRLFLLFGRSTCESMAICESHGVVLARQIIGKPCLIRICKRNVTRAMVKTTVRGMVMESAQTLLSTASTLFGRRQ